MRTKKIVSFLLIGMLLGFAAPAAGSGLLGSYYDNFTRPDGIITFDEADLVLSRIDPGIDFWNETNCSHRWHPVASADWYGVRWTGTIHIDVAGEYAFGTVSDDGSQVWLDGELIINNGEEQWWDWEDSIFEGSYTGLYPEGHGLPDDLPGPLYLTVGHHDVEIRFYEARYYDGIEFWWLKPGSGPSDIPYYGTNCGSGGLNVNEATNWELVPSEMLTPAVSSVPEPGDPATARLMEATPNPFNPQTSIRFDVFRPGEVRVAVYTLDGRRVVTIHDGYCSAGSHLVTWNARDSHGRLMPSGTYLYRLEAAGIVATNTVTLLK